MRRAPWTLLLFITLAGCPTRGVLHFEDTGDAPVVCHQDVEVKVHQQIATLLQVSWAQSLPSQGTWLEFREVGGDWQSSPRRALSAGPAREVALGLHADTEVELRLLSELEVGSCVQPEVHRITTGSLPTSVLEPAVIAWEPTLASPAPWLLFSVDVDPESFYDGPYYTVLLDRDGRVVWYRPSARRRTTMYAQPGETGGYLMLEESTNYTFDGTSQILRLTLDLERVEAMDAPGFSYAFDELPDGTLLRDQIDWNTWEYGIVHQPFGGQAQEVWGCDSWEPDLSWSCYSNTLRWNEGTDTILWSLVSLNTVLEIDRASGEVVHQWGEHPGSAAVLPQEAMFDFQHYPNYTPDHTLLTSNHAVGPGGPEHRAREFALLPDGSLSLVWEYGEGVDEYAYYSGEAARLPGGNTLIAYGTGGAVREVTPHGEVAWDLDFGGYYLIGHLTLVDDLYALNTGW